MGLEIEDGVDFLAIRPQTVLAILAAVSLFQEYGVRCRVTSVVRPPGPKRSLHPLGYAVDLGTGHIDQDTAQSLAALLRGRLPKTFDVVHEEDHIHVEFDILKD